MNLKEVFGGEFGIGWFLPTRVGGEPEPVEVLYDIYEAVMAGHESMKSISLN